MAKTIFDHTKAIFTDKRLDYFDQLDDIDKKSFQPYMVNRIISMNRTALPFVNELQQYGILSARETYLFYSQILPTGPSFSPYIKSKKDKKYSDWLVKTISKYFWVSNNEAIEYISMLIKNPSGKAELREICESVGIDQSLIKKEKL